MRRGCNIHNMYSRRSGLFTLALIWLTSLAVVSPAHAQSALDTGVLRRVKAATAYVVTTIPGHSDTVTGSGFFLDDRGVLLTNAHVVDDFLDYNGAGHIQQAKLEVIVFSGPDEARVITATVLALAADPARLADGTVKHHNDMALLQADISSPTEFLEFGAVDGLVETQQIYAAGYPLGIPEISIREGSISALRHDATGGLAYIEHTAGLDAGNSGGPLITASGEVIGINTWIGGIHANTAISAPVIREFLTANGRSDVDGDSGGWTRIVEDTETTTTATKPTTPAAEAYPHRDILAWALKGEDETIGDFLARHEAEVDALYARIEKSAYQHGVAPGFALAVLAAETVYGNHLSWARRRSWDAYYASEGREATEYPSALADLDTATYELSAILQDLDRLDRVLAYYWCGPDGEWNKDSLFSFKEAVLKLWDSLAPGQ